MKVIIESAIKLSNTQSTNLEQKLTLILGKNLNLSFVTNPSLIGGLRISADNKIVDLSLAAKLNHLSETLTNS